MAGSEFLLLSLGESSRIGGTVRVVAATGSEEEGKKKLDALEPSILGHVALVEVKGHYERRPAVQNVPNDNPLFASER